ncbi:unnamed protein product [Effrenium voratum]|nr:unnamed protein product [Effrenium voratum]CAJ1445913.1 unnamed protein product [Effrenium voratum]
MSCSSVVCGVFVVLTPTKCNNCALRAFLQVDGRKNQQEFEEQDQEAHVLEAPPLPVSPQIFRQARIVDEKKRFKIKWRGYQVSETCLGLSVDKPLDITIAALGDDRRKLSRASRVRRK